MYLQLRGTTRSCFFMQKSGLDSPSGFSIDKERVEL